MLPPTLAEGCNGTASASWRGVIDPRLGHWQTVNHVGPAGHLGIPILIIRGR